MEDQISIFKKEYLALSNRLKKLKNIHYTQCKELENNNVFKKFPNQIYSFTDEIKNLMSKKHEYFNKFCNNKKSIDNLKNFLSTISYNYDQIINTKNNIKSADTLILMQLIDDNLNSIKKEINIPEVELFQKINNIQISISNTDNNSNILYEAKLLKNSSLKKNFDSKNITKNFKLQKRNASNPNLLKNNENKIFYPNSPEFELTKILPSLINKTNKEQNLSLHKGIFNKYEYLINKNKSISKNKISDLNLNNKKYKISIKNNNFDEKYDITYNENGIYLLKYNINFEIF